ncbi:TatD family hydrolase [Tellurirhabdus rosea]|uniref:TatD family hydrolase n=1 Tax=Tellurirhabdus rosea TaxID=2674997 RepID=UPI0022560B23|nr:TatD family hydrolase [Tellurirhabdus rosea]
MLTDAHTHRAEPEPSVFSVYNLPIQEPDPGPCPHPALSVGIHPWNLEPERLEDQLRLVGQGLLKPEVLALGECGLDRLRGPSLHHQTEAFTAQVRLAEERQKPVIIHCVRCFSELLYLRKALRPATPWIIHGFVNKPETARQLLQSGCYLSLGAALLTPDSGAANTLREMPPDRLLLETDDAPLSIREVYRAAAGILGIAEDELIQQIGRTFAEVFNRKP